MQCCQPKLLSCAIMQALTELDSMPSPSLSSASSASGMRMEAARPTSSALRPSAPLVHSPPGGSPAAHSGANGSSAAGTQGEDGQQDSAVDGVEARQPRRRQTWVLEKMGAARKSLDSSRWAAVGGARQRQIVAQLLYYKAQQHGGAAALRLTCALQPTQWRQQALQANSASPLSGIGRIMMGHII